MQHEPEARNCWAPEITYDTRNKEYIIYWATTISGCYTDKNQESEDEYNHRMYYTLTKDFNTFTPARILVDQDVNVIDATIQLLADKYIMFIKDESLCPVQKNIKMAYADHIAGPYSALSEPITGAYWAEGPVIMRNGDQWIVYFDKYKEGKFGAICPKNLKDWTDISKKYHSPKVSGMEQYLKFRNQCS